MADNDATRWMPTAGGILNIVSGALGIIGSLVMLLVAVVIRAGTTQYYLDGRYYGGMEGFWMVFFIIIAIVIALFSIVALISGMFALQRKTWGLALAGSICSILEGGNVLGIISTVFIAMSRREFKS